MVKTCNFWSFVKSKKKKDFSLFSSVISLLSQVYNHPHSSRELKPKPWRCWPTYKNHTTTALCFFSMRLTRSWGLSPSYVAVMMSFGGFFFQKAMMRKEGVMALVSLSSCIICQVIPNTVSKSATVSKSSSEFSG